jgi:hypothetical protein
MFSETYKIHLLVNKRFWWFVTMFTIICHWFLSTVICPIFMKMHQNIILSVPRPSVGFLKVPNWNCVSNSSSVRHLVQSQLRNCDVCRYETFSCYFPTLFLSTLFLNTFSHFFSTLTLYIQPFKFHVFVTAGTLLNLNSHCGTVFSSLIKKRYTF